MVVIGVDAHKRTHTLAVVDEVGSALATPNVPRHTGRAPRCAWVGPNVAGPDVRVGGLP